MYVLIYIKIMKKTKNNSKETINSSDFRTEKNTLWISKIYST